MAYTISEAVHVSTTVDGESVELDFTPGDIDLPEAVADLLVAQGIATPVAAKKAAKSISTESTEA